ncbi:MAG: HAMP domain-containing sensor histidine kinase [Eubacterium sp.]
MQWSLGVSGEVYLVETAKSIINNDTNAEKNESLFNNGVVHDKFGYQYIEWGPDNNVVDMKVIDDDLIMRGYEMAMDPKTAQNDFKVFNLDNSEFRVYSTRFDRDNTEFTLQVFQQITTERSVITYIISFLLFIGTGGILLLIPISYFLAGKSLQPIKETFENQKKFIADASHELRTPLTVIQTNVEVLKLKDEEVLKDNIKWLNNISIESETMAKLVSELLLIAQADNKKVPMNKEVFDLSALCAEIIDLMFDVARENEISLRGNIAEGVEYKGDEERIKQAIRILVDNAIKYTQGKGTVMICLTETKRNTCIAVKDTGIGLTEEEKKKIFSRFYRVDDARNREKGGVGLGLNIADMIVKQHNGKIKIDSVPNEGSTFTIVLPRIMLK